MLLNTLQDILWNKMTLVPAQIKQKDRAVDGGLFMRRVEMCMEQFIYKSII